MVAGIPRIRSCPNFFVSAVLSSSLLYKYLKSFATFPRSYSICDLWLVIGRVFSYVDGVRQINLSCHKLVYHNNVCLEEINHLVFVCGTNVQLMPSALEAIFKSLSPSPACYHCAVWRTSPSRYLNQADCSCNVQFSHGLANQTK
jgi:hypothetical protein